MANHLRPVIHHIVKREIFSAFGRHPLETGFLKDEMVLPGANV
jgi:hypothetical protein